MMEEMTINRNKEARPNFTITINNKSSLISAPSVKTLEIEQYQGPRMFYEAILQLAIVDHNKTFVLATFSGC